MARQFPQTITRRFATALLLAALVAPAGCVGLDSFVGKEEPPRGKVCKVVATWVPHVGFSPDVAHNGTPIPTLGGCVYLFGPNSSLPVEGDGTLTIDLFDLSHADPQTGQPIQLEQWNLDAETLNKTCLKKQYFGWGYTMALPWDRYRPDITRVMFRVRYNPKNGLPLFADPAMVTLDAQNGQPFLERTINTTKR